MNSSATTSKPHLSKPKKFISRSEEFYDFVKELGYQPSKHLLHEHLEYLFQDDETNTFVRKLMVSLKPANALAIPELERFEALKSQNVVLYGPDLEEAVNRHQSVLEIHNRYHDKQRAQNKELQQLLSSQELELHRLRNFEASLTKLTEKQLECDNLKSAKVVQAVQTFIREKERTSNINLRLLSENMTQLEKVTLKLLQCQKESVGVQQFHNDRYISQIDGRQILKEEDKIFQKVHEILRNHAPSLMLKEAGFRAEGDLLSAENAKKIFQKYKDNFDRVRHCIVYEKTRELVHNVIFAELYVCVEKFKENHKTAVQSARMNGCYLKRYHRREVYANITEQLNGDNYVSPQATMLRIRELMVYSMRKQFATLIDIKSHSKRKLERFFSKILNILKAQKVRLTLLRNLSRNESNLYGRLIKNFEDHYALNSSFKKLPSARRNSASELTFEGQILSYIFKSFGALTSLQTISSNSKVNEIRQKIHDKIENVVWKKVEDEQLIFTNHFKHTSKMSEVLHQAHERSWTRVSNRTSEVLRSSKNELKDLDENLKKFKLTSSANLKEKRKIRQDNLQAMKRILSATD